MQERLVAVREQIRTVSVQEYRVRVRVAGSGPPAVLLHGVGESSACWLPVLTALAAERTVYALDWPGHGGSTGFAPAAVQAEAATPILLGTLDALGLVHGPIDLVGNSIGGLKAARLAVQYPARVRSLTLVAPAGFGRDPNPLFGLLIAPGVAEWQLALSRLPFQPAARAAARAALLVTRPWQLPPAWWGEHLAYAYLPGGLETALAEIRAHIDPLGRQKHLLFDVGPRLRVPTFIVWGDCDAMLPVAQAYLAAEFIPGARLRIMPGAVHLPMVAAPDAFVTAVRDFWRTAAPTP